MRRARTWGFTAVELMMSITILTVGAAGVVAMQKAAVQGNQDARDIDMANAIARQWMDRIQRDATLWVPDINVPPNPTANLGAALIVNENFTGQWFLPSARLASSGAQFDVESAGFDPLGRDLPSTASQTEGTPGATGLRFCTNLRLTKIVADGSLIRAEVRVYWPAMLLSAPDPAFCNSVPSAGLDTDTASYHFVYLVSAIRANAQP